MDCNKDEAKRAKEIAVRKFAEKDVIGAAKFALKAQKLYPELEGITHLVANFELHMSAKFRRNGELDWYRMLGVHPSADTEIITKQYRKMALLIHPDKNHEVGSESAFKLLSEAFRVLKDKTMRSIYDQRTNAQSFQQNYNSPAKFDPVVPTAPNPTQTKYSKPADWSQFKKASTTSQQKGNNVNVGGSSGAPPRPVNKKVVKNNAREMNNSKSGHKNQEKTTFWTFCSGCKMQFEYLLMYVNENLLCPDCESVFQAIEIPIPSIWQASAKDFSFFRHQNQKPSQINGSSPGGAVHAADNGKSSVKRVKKGSTDGTKAKRQKTDDSLKGKQKTSKTTVFF